MERFERSVHIPRPPADVFEFCRHGENFQLIFPEPIRPTRDTTETVARPGGEYSFRHWMKGVLPVRWDIRIARYVENELLVDEQVRGPFRHWRHSHLFAPEGDGTRYVDAIEFASPFGARADRTIVRRRIAAIFAHRQARMVELLAPEAAGHDRAGAMS